MKSIKIISLFAISLILILSSCNNSNQTKENSSTNNSKQTDHKTDAKVYQCSMHPHIIKELAGNCPICGMELDAKTYDEALMFLSNYKKEHPDYQEGDSLLKGMKDMKGM